MPIYEIVFKKKAQKFLASQEKSQRLRLYKAIFKLPNEGDIKKLQGSDMYRLRIGPFRVLYIVDHGIKVINVENIDNRGDIYKKP